MKTNIILATCVFFVALLTIPTLGYSGDAEGGWGADTGGWQQDTKDFLEEKEEFKKAMDNNDQQKLKEIYEEKRREAVIKSSPNGQGGSGRLNRAILD